MSADKSNSGTTEIIETVPSEVKVISNEPDLELIEEKPRKKKKRFKALFILLPIIAIVGVAVYFFLNLGSRPVALAGGGFTDFTVGTRDITLSLSGTGSLKPADSYTVTTLISGEILSAPFEEGDIVDKDTVLYEVDSSDVATSIEQSQNSLSQTQRSYNQKVKSLEDLKIKANETGKVIELLVELGDKVSTGQTVARIRNSDVMSLVVPFSSDDAAGFYVGQSAEVTLDGSFETLNGTISKISVLDERLDGNMLVRMVTIDVKNPGGISSGLVATAMVGDIACNGSGSFTYKAESTVTATANGEVSQINVKEGGGVSKNQLMITLKSETLENDIENSANSMRDSELSLENKYDQLDNYSIKSPISGTIIEKNYKEGDNLEQGKALCMIFDLSYLTMTLNVDELDIAKVKVGQDVTVTAEALEGRVFKGYVTKVNINGTTSNGVTSYPVTIRIDETEGLLPGMNVQASIIVSQSKDTLAIPVSALSRGNRVLVKTDEVSQNASQTGLIPEGYKYVEVTPGISDDEFIEILSGLNEGDVIAVQEEVIQSSMNGNFMIGGGGAVQRAAPGGGEMVVTREFQP